jgi:NAD(P)-dependent dehydrogenase (short-subunit alcohol dehydrogenase family)
MNLTPLRARKALVTGAASGLGYEVAAALAAQGMEVILADRDAAGGAAAVARIRAAAPDARVEFRSLDLASLEEVRRFAAHFIGPLHLLVNNAGILPPLQRGQTADGHELAFGIALLGHFALTGLLLPALSRSGGARVVGTTSLVYRQGRIAWDDLAAERRYEPLEAYAQSKLAALMFALELDRRAREAALPIQSLAAHPGIARTAIGAARLQEAPQRLRDRLEMWAFRAAMAWASQSAADGARPLLHAATAPAACGGELYGPGGFQQWFGAPVRLTPVGAATDPAARRRLWETSEQLTDIRWP